MPIARSPFFSEIRNAFKNLEVRTRRNRKIEIGVYRFPRNPRTEAQQKVRTAYGKCVEAWKKLSPEEKADYDSRAEPLGISGFNLFVKEHLPEYLIEAIWYEITIHELSGRTLSDYQVCIVVDGDSQFFADCEGNSDYIRFYDSDSVTKLPYYVEFWSPEEEYAKIWVKVPEIPASSTKKIYMRIDKAFSGSESDPNSVFDFFDDFETWEGWVQYGGGEVKQYCAEAYQGSCCLLKTGNNDPNGGYKALNSALSLPWVLECWVKRINFNGGPTDSFGLIDDYGNGYGFHINHNRDVLIVARRDSYTGIVVASTSLPSDPVSVWYFARLIWDNGNLKIEVYTDKKLAEVTASDSKWSSFTNFYVFGGYEYLVDYVIVRKYAPVEPTVTYERL